MENQILQDVKKNIGINPDVEDEVFDSSIVMHINSAIAELAELGVGSQGAFFIQENNETWGDYVGEDYAYLLALIKQYIVVYVKINFDTATSGALSSSLQEERNRLGFRIMTAIEQHEN
mgnify:CR=1 FL=1